MTESTPTPHLEADIPAIDFYGWLIQLTADRQGIIVQVPEGKLLDLDYGQFRVRSDKKGLEVRAK